MSPKRIARIAEKLAQIPTLPGTAKVEVAVAAEHDGVCTKTVYRHYPLVEISPGRLGVTVEYLRSRKRDIA
jgi:hypothetical protein